MLRVILDIERLPRLSIRVDKSSRKRVLLLVHRAVVAQRKRPVKGDIGDGAPDVDDLEPFLQELGDFFGGEMFANSGDGGFGGLVDVRRGDRLALLRGVVDLAWATTANG